MSTTVTEELFRFFTHTDDPALRARQRRMAEILIEEHPGVGEEMAKIMADMKQEKVVLRQFERRLGRVLDGQERGVLQERLCRLGSDRVADLVIDLDAAGLAAWLADPAAK